MVVNVWELPYLNLDFLKSVKASSVLESQNLYFIDPKESPSAYGLTKAQSPVASGSPENERLKKTISKEVQDRATLLSETAKGRTNPRYFPVVPKCSWPLNSAGLNCTSLLICGIFFGSKYCSTTQFTVGWICDGERQIQRNHAYRWPAISYTWIFNCVEGQRL